MKVNANNYYSVHVLASETITEVETTVLYTCCRDGRAKENHCPKKSSQIRKHHGSRKLEEYCLSRITVRKEKSGKVNAQYIRTHTNHAPGIDEAKHIPLLQAVKEEVREKYGQNVKLDSILGGTLILNIINVLCFN